MTRYFLTFITSALLLFNSCSNGQSPGSNNILSANDFAKKIEQLPFAPVIDVRTPEEFSKGHLKNSLNIDWNGNDFETEISKLDKSRPVFIYCLSGGRSASAASWMRSNGFREVYELQSGILKWRAANLPETTGANTKVTGMNKVQFDELINSDKLVLVDFYADWCEPCKIMEPYLNEISITMSDRVLVVRINSDDNPQLCKELGIDALPVLQLYKNKTLTWNNTGYISKEDVLKKLQ